jgi:mycofactocin biosynthesis protein MftB
VSINTVSELPAVTTAAPWVLNTQVSLRDEEFGALAYHHGNRRLVFLKSPQLVAIVRQLENYESLEAALESHVTPAEYDRYRAALSSLAASEIIHER